MRASGLSAVLAAVLTVLIPAAALSGNVGASEAKQELTSTQPEQSAATALQAGSNDSDEGDAAVQTEQPAESENTTTQALADAKETVLLETEEGTLSLPLDEYLTGVLLAEVPAGFALEAMKAQAVAARTYTLRQMAASRHANGALCADSTCCQAWMSLDRAGEKLGASSETLLETLRQAVHETDGQVLCYDGQLIEATYFSCSGGRTEDAVAVWGTDVPYLQAVDSPGEEAAPWCGIKKVDSLFSRNS